jgi:hypothetical protein
MWRAFERNVAVNVSECEPLASLVTLVTMSLVLLLEESRADPTLVTIEATVVTGFEPIAVEECKEKISKLISVAIARGRVFFNIYIHKMNIVS